MKVKVVKKNVGMTIDEAFDKAYELVKDMKMFRVQAWNGGEIPVATWATLAGDLPNEIGRHSAWGPRFVKGECDIIKVIDDTENKVVATILVNG